MPVGVPLDWGSRKVSPRRWHVSRVWADEKEVATKRQRQVFQAEEEHTAQKVASDRGTT